MELIAEVKQAGFTITLEGEKIRVEHDGPGEPPGEAIALLEPLREHKSEVIAYLREAMPKPYLEPDGGLVIPFNSDRRYHWWGGGQSITKTKREITGAVNA